MSTRHDEHDPRDGVGQSAGPEHDAVPTDGDIEDLDPGSEGLENVVGGVATKTLLNVPYNPDAENYDVKTNRAT
jgi:hypothetical protein